MRNLSTLRFAHTEWVPVPDDKRRALFSKNFRANKREARGDEKPNAPGDYQNQHDCFGHSVGACS
jgi:hypothetical protein